MMGAGELGTALHAGSSACARLTVVPHEHEKRVCHLFHLRLVIGANPRLPRTGLGVYVNNAMAHYLAVQASAGVLFVPVARSLLTLAHWGDLHDLDMDNVLPLARQEPRHGIRLLWVLCTWSHDGLADYIDPIVGILVDYHGRSRHAPVLIERLSWWAPAEVADAIVCRGSSAMHRAHATSRGCKWCMVDYLQTHMHLDSRPAEQLLADNTRRAVRAGVFTSGCVLGDLEWPELTLEGCLRLHIDSTDTLVFHMATRHEVPHKALRFLESVPEPAVTVLIEKVPSLADHVRRARNWIRRGAFLTDVVMYCARVRGNVRRKGERPGDGFHTVVTDDQMGIMKLVMSYV